VPLILTIRSFSCILIMGAVSLSLLYPYPYSRIIKEVHFGYEISTGPTLLLKPEGKR